MAISLYAASDCESYLGHEAVLQMASSSVTSPICHNKWKSDTSEDTGFVLSNWSCIEKDTEEHKQNGEVYFVANPDLRL